MPNTVLHFESNEKKRGYLSWFEGSCNSTRAKLVQYPNPYWPASWANLEQATKTVRGIKGFVANTNAVAKLILNQSYQAENLSCLHKMCNLINRHSYILGSEDMVLKVINIFKNYYINCLMHFWKKSHFKTSAVVLQCLLRLLVIFSHYMKREKIFAIIFSKVESLQQQKHFTIRSQEITTKCFWQKISSSCT